MCVFFFIQFCINLYFFLVFCLTMTVSFLGAVAVAAAVAFRLLTEDAHVIHYVFMHVAFIISILNI